MLRYLTVMILMWGLGSLPLVVIGFVVAGIVPGFLALAAIVVPRLDRDELAHPLDHPEPVPVQGLSGSMQNGSKGSER